MENKGYIKFVFIILINILFSVPAVRESWGINDRIVAIVNDEIITESELENSKVFSQKSISFLVEKKLQLQIAKKKGIFIQASEVSSALDDIKRVNSFKSDKELEDALSKDGNSLEEYKREITEQLTLLKLLNMEIKSKITVNDKELEGYYSLNRKLFSLPEQIRVGYIYIPINASDPVETNQRTQKMITEILSDLKGGITFSEIINRYSKNPQIHVIEDLGYVKKGELLQELDTVAFNLKGGEISDVISTPAGFYIIKILDKKETEYKPFNEVKDTVSEGLFQDKTERLYKEWLYELKSASYIEVNL